MENEVGIIIVLSLTQVKHITKVMPLVRKAGPERAELGLFAAWPTWPPRSSPQTGLALLYFIREMTHLVSLAYSRCRHCAISG